MGFKKLGLCNFFSKSKKLGSEFLESGKGLKNLGELLIFCLSRKKWVEVFRVGKGVKIWGCYFLSMAKKLGCNFLESGGGL
jgi:hypothetical protein